MPFNVSKKIISALMMFAVGVTVCGIEIYIPSLPYLQKYFLTTEKMMQMSITASIIGSSIITIFLGALTDAVGRRKVLLIFQALYALVSLMIIFSPNMETFLALRFVTGIAATGGFTITFVVIGDIFDEKEASDYYAYLTSSILISLMLAPFFGGIFAQMNHWEYSFLLLSFLATLSVISIWLFVPETLQTKRPFNLRTLWGQISSIVFKPTFYNYTIIHSVLIGSVISFFATSSFYYINKLNISPEKFSLHVVALSLVNLIASIVTPKFFDKFGVQNTLKFALGLSLLGSVLFTIFSITYPTHEIILSAAASFFIFGSGMCVIACIAMVMNSFPEGRATASSMIVLVRGIMLSVCISIGSLLYHGEALQIGYTFMFFIIVSIFFYFIQRIQGKNV